MIARSTVAMVAPAAPMVALLLTPMVLQRLAVPMEPVWSAAVLWAGAAVFLLALIIRRQSHAGLRPLVLAFIPAGVLLGVALLHGSSSARIAGAGFEMGTVLYAGGLAAFFGVGVWWRALPLVVGGVWGALFSGALLLGDGETASWFAASGALWAFVHVREQPGLALLCGALFVGAITITGNMVVVGSLAGVLACWAVVVPRDKRIRITVLLAASVLAALVFAGTVPLVQSDGVYIRPSLAATMHTIGALYAIDPSTAVWGAPGGTFESAWAAARPQAFNELDAWGTDMPEGFSVFTTLLAVLGVPLTLGVALVYGGGALYAGLATRGGRLGSDELFWLLLWYLVILCVSSPPLVWHAAMLWVLGTLVSPSVSYGHTTLQQAMWVCSILALLIFISFTRILYAAPLTRALSIEHASAQQLSVREGEVLELLKGAASVPFAPAVAHLTYVARAAAQADRQALQEANREITAPSERVQKALQAVESAARNAVQQYENDYRTHVQFARSLVAVAEYANDSTRYEEAKTHLQRAHELAPMHPGPLYALAQLEALLGERESALAHLHVLLTKTKADSPEARALVERLGGVVY